jgi:DNA-binding MarR family transcriptional regulator
MPFDTLIANPARLSILTSLASDAPREFVALRRHTGLTDGNLSAHAKRLEGAGLISIEKRFRQNRPVTTYHLTRAGRAALREHANRIIDAVDPHLQMIENAPDPRRPEPADWLESD